MEIELTKDADNLICTAYHLYLKRLEEGMSKSNAGYFDTDTPALTALFSHDDLVHTVRELKNAGLAVMYIRGSFRLTDQAILYMEKRFSNGVDQLLERIGKIKALIPFI